MCQCTHSEACTSLMYLLRRSRSCKGHPPGSRTATAAPPSSQCPGLYRSQTPGHHQNIYSSRPHLGRQDVDRLRVQGVQTQLAPPLGLPSRVREVQDGRQPSCIHSLVAVKVDGEAAPTACLLSAVSCEASEIIVAAVLSTMRGEQPLLLAGRLLKGRQLPLCVYVALGIKIVLGPCSGSVMTYYSGRSSYCCYNSGKRSCLEIQHDHLGCLRSSGAMHKTSRSRDASHQLSSTCCRSVPALACSFMVWAVSCKWGMNKLSSVRSVPSLATAACWGAASSVACRGTRSHVLLLFMVQVCGIHMGD